MSQFRKSSIAASHLKNTLADGAQLSSAQESEPLGQSLPITSYDVSPDGTEIMFAVKPEQGAAEIWLTSRGGADPPRRLTSSGEDEPRFGPAGEILFR